MPRQGSISCDILMLFEKRRAEMGLAEIERDLNEIRRFPVKPHSVRSALYQHLGSQGEQLFVRTGRGRYSLRK